MPRHCYDVPNHSMPQIFNYLFVKNKRSVVKLNKKVVICLSIVHPAIVPHFCKCGLSWSVKM